MVKKKIKHTYITKHGYITKLSFKEVARLNNEQLYGLTIIKNLPEPENINDDTLSFLDTYKLPKSKFNIANFQKFKVIMLEHEADIMRSIQNGAIDMRNQQLIL